ncbi:hypothetical protein [Falsiroseomonas sp. HW251]|uniref:hypothetical protein n=1 Tax=Falsiroseomonas sp. HW251 TaxID=3390998 RepID=UPI003D30F1EC
MPLLTLHSWAGGNLAAEFQYALFNPVMLALYAVLPAFDDQAAAAAFLSIALSGVLTAGGLALGRALGLPVGLAHVAATAIGGNAFLHFWFAVSWFPGFAATAYLVWAMAFVAIAHRGRGTFLGCVAATFLTTTAGWPQAVVALGAFTFVWLVALQRCQGWRPALDAGSAALLGVLTGAVGIGPLVGVAEVARRSTEIGNAGLLVANLRDVLSLSSPLHFAVLPFFDHATLLQAPVFMAAWFVLPLAALIDWPRVSWKEPEVATLVGFAGLMVLATQGPSQLLWMRYPIKFLPYVQIGAVLLVLVPRGAAARCCARTAPAGGGHLPAIRRAARDRWGGIAGHGAAGLRTHYRGAGLLGQAYGQNAGTALRPDRVAAGTGHGERILPNWSSRLVAAVLL